MSAVLAPVQDAVEAQPLPPAPPATIAETGLHPDSLSQLLLKTLVAGEATGTALADKLRLPYSVLDALVQHARVEKLVEVRGTTGTGTAGYRYALTDLGRDRAMQFLDISRYVGPAPVPLAHYNAYVRACMAARPYVDRDRLATGFEQLIVGKGMLDALGPAVNSGKALFLYGAPGNGKTVLAEGIGKALGTEMYVPYAIDVDGQVITTFDAVNHVSLDGPEHSMSVIAAASLDRRWLKIRRPVVVVGGELTLDMLDLTFNPIVEVLRSADPDEGQRRRVRGRRLRAPADSAARPAEPLDRAAREPGRLPDAAHRPEVRDPVQRADRVRDQPQAGVARGRGVPAPHPLQDSREESDRRRVLPDLRDELPQAAAWRSIRSWSSTCSGSITSRASCRCARVTRAIWSSRWSTTAAIRDASR